jgi:carboxyl-terminal processing protease
MVFALLGLRGFAADDAALAKGADALKREAYDEALAVFDGILQGDPSNEGAYLGRGRAYLGKDDSEHAVADFTEALELQSKSKDALWYRHGANFNLGEYEKALADLNVLLEMSPDDVADRRARARTYSRLKNFGAAMIDVERARSLDPKNVEIIALRADILAAAKSYPEAIDDYSTAIRMKDKTADYYYQRGWLYGKTGRYQEAIDDTRDAIRLKKDGDMYINDLAWIFATCPEAKFHDGPKAVELATRACELTAWKEPGELDTLAAAYARTGDFENAVRWQSKAVELEKESQSKQELRARLTQYQGREPYLQQPEDKDKIDWSLLRSACFDAVWTTVNENYFDVTFGGVDWRAVREKYRLRLWEEEDNRMLRGLLQNMLGELHRTHFAIVPREMSVLKPEERGRIGYTGAQAASIEDAITIMRVKPGSPAEKAGLKPGDIVRRVDAVVLSEMAASLSESVPSARKRMFYLRSFVNWRLAAPVGKTVGLQLEAPDGALREVKVVSRPVEGIWSEPMGYAPAEPIECEIGHGPPGVVWMRFNVFALPVMTEFKRCVRSLKPGDGLVLDLRGNPGGLTLIAPGIYGRLSEKEVSLGTMHQRYGTEEFMAYPQRGAFTGPVAVLVDSASASTSEILAAGLQAFGRARVFGELTAGAALPSLFRQLPNGDMLQYAVADIKTPQGVLIEGNGVAPDEPVTVRRADCIAGHDPVLEAAERWLATRRNAGAKEVAAK